MSRREFLRQAASAAGALLMSGVQTSATTRPPTASKSLRVLILGGTGFIGPHYVRAAVTRGHHVSVFNRGKSKVALPRSVERLVGDRNKDLESIKNRNWDAVIDLATYVPNWVRVLGGALKDRVSHYTFVSTVAVYKNPERNGRTSESCPLLEYGGRLDPYQLTEPGEHYGALKALCEYEAENQFSGRTLVLRPGCIVGPGDPLGTLTYWPARMERGGEVLASADPRMSVQFIDVRDLAEWSLRMIERKARDTYNVVGPVDDTTFGQLLEIASHTVRASLNITWVPSSWLAARKDREMWSKVLFWSFESEGFGEIMRMSVDRAHSDGLTTRPIYVTLADTLEWYKSQPLNSRAQFLSIHKKKGDGTGFELMTISWPDYIAREKETIAAWSAEITQNE